MVALDEVECHGNETSLLGLSSLPLSSRQLLPRRGRGRRLLSAQLGAVDTLLALSPFLTLLLLIITMNT